jgi:hypothetical protein
VRVSPRSNASGGSPIERGFGPSEGAMAQRHNADLFEVLICQIRKDGKIDVVLGTALEDPIPSAGEVLMVNGGAVGYKCDIRANSPIMLARRGGC